MTKLRLVALDIDGTLLDENRQIPDYLISKIQELSKQGVMFTLATGRVFPSALPYAKQLGLRLPLIACNGALIKDSLNGRVIFHRQLERSIAAEVLAVLQRERWDTLKYFFYEDDTVTDLEHEYTQAYEKALGVSFQRVQDIFHHVLKEREVDPTMLALICQQEKCSQVTAHIAKIFGGKIFLTNSHEYFVEILHPQANKGRALLHLAKELKLKPEEILAVGDNRNDITMLHAAGVGALVGNSPKCIQQEADWVAVKERSAGVLEVLDHFFR